MKEKIQKTKETIKKGLIEEGEIEELKKSLKKCGKGIHIKEEYAEFLNENYPLKITPISANNDQCIITMGSEIVVPLIFDNKEIAKEYIEEKPIGLIFGTIATVIEMNKKLTKENK